MRRTSKRWPGTSINVGSLLARVCSIVMCMALAALVRAEEAQQPGAAAHTQVDFARQVLPILSDKCFICHGPDAAAEESLRLDSFEGATADLGGYQAIDPDHPEQSMLVERILSADDPMPPRDADKQLSEAERKILQQWVAEGGSYAKHWAFVAPSRTADYPGGQSASIDALVERKLQPLGKGLAAPADRTQLARRAALVLTGLPPEPEVLRAFLEDEADDAYGRYLDQLFASPRYGEHQARYWLDAVRYGDTHGLHLDNRRGIYPYRDWVVRAFNRNLPLDQFIQWQLAGDLLPNPTLDQLVATGFVRLNPSTSEGGAIADEFQAKNNFDRTETLGTVLLGMSLTCARCHTHKYDPITQTEYYQLLAFFNNTAEKPLDGNKYDYAPVVKAPNNQSEWRDYDAWELLRRLLLAGLPQEQTDRIQGWQQQSPAEQFNALTDEQGPFADSVFQAAAAKLEQDKTALFESFTTTLVAKELDKPRETKLLHRGEYDQPKGDPLSPGVLSVMGDLPESAPRNRLGLAEWLTSREHPLVARVLVNRLWQRVFGYGLVRTPEDFGLQGEHPTHPELLDWLAVELHESGWDMQHLLRLMLQSRTFCQSSAWRTDLDDPENRLFARGPSYRLDAEVIRDMALWASNLLDPKMGGPGVKPYQPDGMWAALAHPASNTKKYERDEGERLYRRSLYVYWKRTSPHPMMTLFDAPDRESSCVRRSRTNTSLQSLGLFNETQRIEMARKFAERLLTSHAQDTARIDLAFELLACRPATADERATCQQLLNGLRTRYRQDQAGALALLSLGDAPRDESLPAEELAAWTQVGVVLLASDIALLLY